MAERRHPLASFVPLTLERRLRDGFVPEPGLDRRQGVVLAADMTGFTALAASLAVEAEGVDELTGVLNAGFGRLIEAVTSAGGDVLGFAGDALTAYWDDPTDAGDAFAAALDAQRRLAAGDNRVRVRIGVAAGTVDLWNVGGEGGQWILVASGDAVAEAMRLQGVAGPGDVATATDLEGLVAQAASAASSRRGEPALSDDDVADLVGGYLPAAVVDRLGAGYGHFVSELRRVTAMFVSVPTMTTDGDLASLQRLATEFQRTASAFGGTVNKISVDEKGAAALIVFGLPPHRHEDDADRALSAALALARHLDAAGVRFGVGVASGQVFCGTVGTDQRREFTVIGDPVNVAARLAGAAVGDARPAVLCSARTASDASRRWELGAPILLEVKGRSDPLTIFEPLRRTAVRSVATTPIVGRHAELARIEAAIAASATGGDRPTLVLVEAPAGMGKSRLLLETQRMANDLGRAVLLGGGDALTALTPYHAWRAVLADVLQIDLFAGPVGAELLDRAGPEAPLLGPVLGVELAETDRTSGLVGEARVVATRRLLGQLIGVHVAGCGPTVVLLEDAHWFDSASWAMVGTVAAIPDVVVVCTTRPTDDRSRDAARLLAAPTTEVILLDSLGREDVAALASVRLGVPAVPDALTVLLDERCGGNPFFITEVLTSLERSGILEVDPPAVTLGDTSVVELPDSIEAALTSRIDQLSADQQLTLKVASVVGEPFDNAVLAAVHPTGRPPDAVAEDLSVLHAVDFAVPAAPPAFGFKHALVREAAYRLMLVAQRQTLHRAVAEHFEASVADVRPVAATLAGHWLAAAAEDKAVDYLQIAAVDALAHGMPRESVDHGVRAARVLGIDLATTPEEIAALLPSELAEVGRLLDGRRPRDLTELPPLVDERVGTGIGLLLQAMPSAHQSLQTELFALMAVRNLALTLRHGTTPFTPAVYSMYSIVLRGLGLDSRLAFEFSETGRALDAATGDHLAAATTFIHVWFNNHWFAPMRSSVEPALTGGAAGLAGPDLLYGSFDLAAATTLLATGGAHLDEVIDMGERHVGRIGDNSATASFHNRLEAQMAKALAGRTADLTSLTDAWCDESLLADMAGTDNYNQTAYYFIAKCRLAYLAGDAATARAYAAQAYPLLPAFAGQVGEIELTVLSGLAALADGDRAEGELRAAQLRSWCDGCPENFLHKALLVEGELARVDGYLDRAEANLHEAETVAHRDGFPQWAALAAERRGVAFDGVDRPRASAAYGIAADHYERWGAARRADDCRTRSR